ncbi:hypothetical protein [Nocardioides sp. InS609-2]|uniref:hypothetical protein n=1 Tax=Nocardioides sp. InS609-2 TaxID=2760705 RepID=UPI00185B36D8|nr:hypothetical protein [Nocardioides sp. InS609-2]MBA3782616.1 hypothetical protein [Nocardioides sp.]
MVEDILDQPDGRIIASPSSEAWTLLVEECMDHLDGRDRDRPESRLVWLATRLQEFLGLRAWWVAASFERELVTVDSSGHGPVQGQIDRLDDARLLIDGCDPDAQEWLLVLQRGPGGYDLRLARPLVTALVYAALGFPRPPAASGVRWPARRFDSTA